MSKIIITQAMFDSWNVGIDDVAYGVAYKETGNQYEWESNIKVPGYNSKLQVGYFPCMQDERSRKQFALAWKDEIEVYEVRDIPSNKILGTFEKEAGSFILMENEGPRKQFALAWKDEFEKYEIEDDFEPSIRERIYEEVNCHNQNYFFDLSREEQFEYLDKEDNGESEDELLLICLRKPYFYEKFMNVWIKDELITLYQKHVLGIELADD